VNIKTPACQIIGPAAAGSAGTVPAPVRSEMGGSGFACCRARNGGPTCVYSLVDLEVLGAREDLAARRVRAGERAFAGVDADVVDELVLGLERPAESVARTPVARVVGLLGAADVVDSQVRYQLHHRREATPAHRRRRIALRLRLARLDALCTSYGSSVIIRLSSHWRQPRRGCRGHIPQYFGWGTSTGISPQYYDIYFRI